MHKYYFLEVYDVSLKHIKYRKTNKSDNFKKIIPNLIKLILIYETLFNLFLVMH